MKARNILIAVLIVFGLLSCSDISNPVSPGDPFGSGTSQNESGTSQNESGTSQNESGTSQNE